MHEVSMHKQMGEILVWIKKLRKRIVQTKALVKTKSKLLFENSFGEPEKSVDNQQILNYNRQYIKRRGPVFLIAHKVIRSILTCALLKFFINLLRVQRYKCWSS